MLVLAAWPASGCGTTEKSGELGDTLDANGIEVTVTEVDASVPLPKHDVTGLSRPLPGSKLLGARVEVCSDHGGATGPFDFGVETSAGNGRLKYPQRNYDKSFEPLRDDCGDGWVVFDIPAGSTAERVTFGFEDTGAVRQEQNRVDARFEWAIEAAR